MSDVRLCARDCGRKLYSNNKTGVCVACRRERKPERLEDKPNARKCSRDCGRAISSANVTGVCAWCQGRKQRALEREVAERVQGAFRVPSDQRAASEDQVIHLPCCGRERDASSLRVDCVCGALWTATFGWKGDVAKLVRLDRWR